MIRQSQSKRLPGRLFKFKTEVKSVLFGLRHKRTSEFVLANGTPHVDEFKTHSQFKFIVRCRFFDGYLLFD